MARKCQSCFNRYRVSAFPICASNEERILHNLSLLSTFFFAFSQHRFFGQTIIIFFALFPRKGLVLDKFSKNSIA